MNLDSAKLFYVNNYEEIQHLQDSINYEAEWNFSLAEIMSSKSFDSSIVYYDKALNLFNESKSYNRMAWANYKKAIPLFYLDRRKEAIRILNHAIDLNNNEPDTLNLAGVYSLLGVIYNSVGQPGKAIKVNKKASKFLKHMKRYAILGGTYSNISNRYYDLGLYKEALKYLIKADSICKQVECSNTYYAKNWINLGRVYKTLEMIDSSDYYYQKVQKDSAADNSILLTLYRNWSRDKLEIDPKLAIEYAQKYASINSHKGLNNSINLNLVLGRAYGNKRASEEAKQYLLTARRDALEINDLAYVVEIDKVLAKQYLLSNDPESAIKYLEESITNNLSLRQNGLAAIKNLSDDVFKNYRLVIQKDQEIKLLKIKNSKKFINLIIFSCLAFMAIILGIIYAKLKANQLEQKIITQNQNLNSIKKEKLKQEKEQILIDLSIKEKEIEDAKSQILEKNELIETLAKGTLSSNVDPSPAVLSSLSQEIETLKNTQSDWNEFSKRFDDLHDNFLNKLASLYPKLNDKEKRLCALLKMNLNSKEIASLLNINHGSVNTARYRLRKKLNIQDKTILKFFQEFNEKVNA